LRQKILYIAKSDETYRQLLLESEGFTVRRVDPRDARCVLTTDTYPLAVITTEDGLQETVELCRDLKTHAPTTRVLVLAQRADYLPPDRCIDFVIREQYSPGHFVSAFRRLLNGEKSVAAE
jgi:DNA-binding NarL/FixJ family response regulator